jgi:uncharacterized membrane protein SpoIIM required for sporulation
MPHALELITMFAFIGLAGFWLGLEFSSRFPPAPSGAGERSESSKASVKS